MIKEWVKSVIKLLPFAFTKNQAYDKQTLKIMNKVLGPNSNTVDVGCHKGEILDQILKRSPHGTHFAFEPIPFLYEKLLHKYFHYKKVKVYNYALANKEGISEFNYVLSNPAYSGIKKRAYDKPNEQDKLIHVQTQKLDELVPKDIAIDFIKIDVEGGELDVLRGAYGILSRNKPCLIFEHGIGGSDIYGTKPVHIYELLEPLGYKIYTMKNWLAHESAFSLQEFEAQFYQKLNYYFIAMYEA